MNPVLQKLAVLAVMMLTYLCASAYDFDTGGIYYNITDPTAKEVEVTKGDNRYSGSIVVPSSVTYNNEEYSVTAIGESVFSWCDGLTSITLPNSVTTIGDYAFSDCYGLTSIDVDSDNQMYSSVDGILYDKAQTILIQCPGGKTGDVIVPNTVTTIGDFAFSGCYGLTSIDVDSDNQKYSSVDGILYDKAQTILIQCPGGKTGDVIVPNTVTTIGDFAFSSCYGLTSITLPNSVTAIGEGAFAGCNGLTSITSHAVTPPRCGNYTFDGVDKEKCFLFVPAESIEAYKQAEGWKDFAFIAEFGTVRNFEVDGIYYNVTDSKAKEVEVAKGENAYSGDIVVPSTVTYNDTQYTVTTIGNDAFAYCNGLISITLPNTVTAIGRAAIAYCRNLTSITSHAVTPPGCSDDAFNGVDKEKCAIYVPAESIDAYKQAEGWKDFAFIAEVGTVRNFEVDGIRYNVTDSKAKEVEVAKGENAYSGDIVVPSTVTYNDVQYTVTAIGNEAFRECYSLTSITLPNSLTTIGNSAFSSCRSLTSITSLAVTPPVCADEHTFDDVDKHKCALFVPAESVDAYKQATGWKDFGFIAEVGAVRSFEVDGIYYNVTDPTAKEVEVTSGENKYSGDIVVPSTVTYNNMQYTVTAIGYRAFGNCSGLTSVTLPNSLTTIGNEAFRRCESLTSIIIPNSVTTIGDGAFCFCYNLTSVTIPSSVTTIGVEVFISCRSMMRIDVDADNQMYISIDGILYDKAQTSLKQCPAGKTGDVIAPNTVTTIEEGAFYGCNSLTSITLPNSVTTIGDFAFYGCNSLTSITSHAVTPPECGDYAFGGVDKQNCILYVPAESIDAYKQAEGWKDFAYIDEIGSVRNFEVDGIYYIVTDKTAKEVAVTKNENGYSGDITVPSTVTYNDTQYTVTAIGERAFSSCPGLTSITLPNSVTTIGNKAFAWCDNLTSITSHAVTPPGCGESAFDGVDKQKCFLLVLVESIDAYKQAEGWKDFAFIAEVGTVRNFEVDGIYYNVTDPTAMEVEVTNGENAYSGEITVPSTVTYNNKEYTVTAIGKQAFYNCSGLTSITLPNSVTTIGVSAFRGCSGLTSITLPNSLTTIGDMAFYRCTGLSTITLPNSVTSVGNSAFYYCTGLTSITLPNSLTTIGDAAFYRCSGLTTITLPNAVTSIGMNAFGSCQGLISITSHAVTPPGCGNYAFNGVNKEKCFLFVPAESIDAYKQAEGWKDFAYIDEIGAVRIFDVDGIRYIVTNKTAKEVEVTNGENAYSGEITVPSTVTYNDTQYTVTAIGNQAFYNCSGLTSITLPNSVTTIGEWTFAYCQGLTSVTLPNSVTTIGDYAFAYCSGLTSITLPNSLTAIGNEAFYRCSGLTSVTLPNSLTAIGNRAFYRCSGLTTITLPNTVTAIGDEAFYGCHGLTTITIPNSVMTIGEGAFAYCSGLTSIDVDSDNQMYSSAEGILYDKAQTSLIQCPGGKTGDMIVPNSVTTIGHDAFGGCRGLTSITSHAVTPPGCGDYAFNGVDKQNCILYVPAESVDAYKQAEWWKDFAFIDEIGAVRSFEVDGIRYIVTDKTAKEVKVAKNAYSGDITVPSTVTYNVQYTVTAIGNQAFSGCSDLTSITLPNSVTSIGEYAFGVCCGLTSITSHAVTPPGCGDYAFGGVDKQNCILYVPAESIDAYKQATEWKDFAIIDEIGAVRSFEVDGIHYIVTDKTTKEVNVAKSENAYSGDITVPSTVTYSNVQYTVTAIGYMAFARCSGLTSVTLPNSLTAIGDYAFTECYGLTSITLPNSVTSIGEGAFYGCHGLTTIILPNSLTFIGLGAFCDCDGLTSVTSLAVTPPECGYYAFDGVDKENCILYVPAESVDAYKQAPVWKEFGTIEEIKEEDADSFEVDGIYYNVTDKTAKEVEVAKGENEYSGDITVPASVSYNDKQYTVTAVSDRAFYECGDLKSVILPNTVTEIRDHTFYGCDSLATVTLPEAVTTIGKQVFAGCYNLASVAIPGSVTAIGDGAFANCSALTSIDVDEDNQMYSSVDGILYDKEQTSLICCPGGVKGDVIVPNTVTTVCDHAFAGCSYLTTITLPDAVTTIGSYAFSYCYSLTSVTLPASVNTIGKNAFADCRSLTSVTSLATVPPVCGTYAFDGVDVDNCTLYVPAESVDAYKEAPVWKEFGLIEEYGAVSGIGSIDADSMADEDVEVFSVSGAKVSDTLENLPAGMYIVRNGSTVRKVVIR